MRRLRAPRGGETVGVFACEVAALMSRAARLWGALGDAEVARLRDEGMRQEGVRRLVADDEEVLLALALAELADASRALARAVARLSGRCADPLLRQFECLYAGLVKDSADPHGLRYAAAKKMERKARKMERLVGATADLYQELEVLAELEQALRRAPPEAEAARRVLWQRQEVKRLRAASLWNRSFDYAIRLLARSLFTIVARIRQVFGLEPKNDTGDDDAKVSPTGVRLSRSNSFIGFSPSMVYPSDYAMDTTPRFLLSRSQTSRLKWSVASSPFIGCVVGRSGSPVIKTWSHGDHALPPRFSSVAAGVDDFSVDSRGNDINAKVTMPMFELSHNVAANAPESTLGAAALALHYANLIVLIEKLAVSPHLICTDKRDELYSMLTARIRASLGARLKSYAKKQVSSAYDPDMVAEWTETMQRILGWLAPLAHNMIRRQSDRNFEQRSVVASTGVLLLETLHFANQKKTEAAITELLVGLNYLWRSGRGHDAKAKLECAGSGNYRRCWDYVG